MSVNNKSTILASKLGHNFTTLLSGIINETLLDNSSTAVSTGGRPVSSNVIDIASRSVAFQAGIAIHKFWLPTVVLLGIPGNLLSFLVMLKQHNRRISCCVYMAVLALCDNLMLAVGATFWAKTTIAGTGPISSLECKVMVYLAQVGSESGIYLILAMSLDRVLAVRYPLNAPMLCTPRRAKITSIVLFISILIFSVPQFIYARGTQGSRVSKTLLFY